VWPSRVRLDLAAKIRHQDAKVMWFWPRCLAKFSQQKAIRNQFPRVAQIENDGIGRP
jgi:hypothetical protein